MVKSMILKQKILLIIIAVLFLISFGVNVSRLISGPQNYKIYAEALRQYEEDNFYDSYDLFGRVSRFSRLKPAAVYRQALCANKLRDVKLEMRRYKEIIRYYPSSIFITRVKYLKAQQSYEDKNFRRAKKEFKEILNKYPNTDYAIASEYFLASIEIEDLENIKNERKKLKIENRIVQYLKAYLKAAPTGKFAMNCLQKWISLDTKLNREDNLLIAKVYQENQNYKNSQKYLKNTNISVSWPYFVKNAYAMGNYANVRYYTEQGLKGKGSDEVLINEDIDDKIENQNIYKAIDLYLKVSNSPKAAISYLASISENSRGHDYLLYKNCNNLPVSQQTACFNTLFYKYPEGQFAAESLSNIFYDKVKTQKYFIAEKLGRIHLAKFADSKSAPKVTFWLAKVSERTKNYKDARMYYRRLIRKYPDDYYAYHAFLNLNRFKHFNSIKLKQKPVEFPYKNSNYKLIAELIKVKDYGLISQLYKDDRFIQSWLYHQQGDFSNSARIARMAMEELEPKPDRFDLRWRLVYPIHYYDKIKEYARRWNNDSVLILSILREESYFNPEAKSAAGARGLMQLMPATAREVAERAGMELPNSRMLFEPDINIKLGNIYYSILKKTLSDKDILAVLAYNGGLGSVSRWKTNLNYTDIDDFIEQIPYPETQNYLNKVYRSYWNYLRIYNGIKW